MTCFEARLRIHSHARVWAWISFFTVIACGGRQPLETGQPEPVEEPVTESAPSPQREIVDELEVVPESEATSAPDVGALEPEIPVRDDTVVRVEGAPPIPEPLTTELNRYLNTRSASVADLSDDGKRMLVRTRFGSTDQVHLVSSPLGARTQLTFAAEPTGSARFLPGEAKSLLYSADVGGNEQHQIHRLDLTRGTTVSLTDPKSRNGSLVASYDGSQIAYGSTARNGRDFDIWIGDGRSADSARRLVEVEGWWYPLDFSRDGASLLVGEYISVNESRIYIVDVKTGELTRISPEGKASYGSALFSRSGKSVYLKSDREGEFTELYQYIVGSQEWRPLSRHIPWNVESMTLSPDGNTLAFSTNEDGLSVLQLLNTQSRKVTAVGGIPRGVMGRIQFARKAPVIAFTLSGADNPGDAFTYDVQKKKLTRWTQSELGGLDPTTLAVPELIHYRTFDGAQIPAFYYRPQGQGPFPVLISIHGGPESQSRPRFSALTQFMVNHEKIAVVYPNVRGSEGYGKTYLTLDNGFKREDSVKDIGSLLDWIDSRPELNGKKVGVVGGSYGGYMVLASLILYAERIVAGTDVVGISNFVTFLENTSEYRRDLRRVEYGDERDAKMRAHLESISPTNRVESIRSALFVAQGANDPRVPASEAEQIVRAVRKAGQSVWYMLARNEGHGFKKKENKDLYLQLTALFFRTHLLSP